MSTKAMPFSELHMAAGKEDFETVRTLIQSGADVNLHDPKLNVTPIFLAVANATDTRIVEELVRAGADLNATAKDQLTPLMSAVYLEKLEIVSFLLDNGAKIDARTKKCDSALHEAAKRGFLDICELLIERGLDVNIRNEQEETPLHSAVNLGEKEAVQLLLRKGADINAGACVVMNLPDETVALGSNVTPVFMAAVWNEPEIVDVLIKAGANVNAKTSLSYTALYPAAQEGYIDIVKMLIAAGIDVNVRTNIGRVPLYAAAKNGRADVVEALLNVEGVEVNPVADNEETPMIIAAMNGDVAVLKLLIAHGAPIDDQSFLNITPLHAALLKNQEHAAKFLIENGADACAANFLLDTPLYQAITESCSLNTIMSLVEKGANIDRRAGDGATPLQLAAEYDRIDIVKYLISQGADPDVPDRSNRTALHCAASIGSIEIVRYLITKVGDIDAVSDTLATPLHSATFGGYCDVAKILLKSGANANAQDESKITPLHLVANKGQVEIAELLLNHKAVIDLKDENGCTPLFLAVRENHEKLVELLLDKGADVNMVNKSGVLPIHVATKAGNLVMVKALLDKGACYDATIQTEDYLGSPLEIAQKAGNTKLITVFDLIENLFCAVIRNETCEVGCCVQIGAIVNARNTSGRTVLHYAVNNGNIDLIKVLLANNADIGLATNEGKLPLHTAIANGSNEVVELFLVHTNKLSFAKRNQVINAKTTVDGATALHVAAEANAFHMVELLLKNGAIYNARNKSKKTPLDLTTDEKIKSLLMFAEKLFEAVKKGCLEDVTQILGNENSAVNARDLDGGGTPLYWAVSKGHLDIASFLLTSGADYCLVTNKGTTPLHIAALKGNVETVKALVMKVKNDNAEKASKFINLQTASRTAALHVASNIHVVKCLLQAGAMYDICNGENETALELARNDEVKKLLRITHQLFEIVSKNDIVEAEVLKTLEELGTAEFEAIANTKNKQGQTLMEVALANTQVKIASRLLERSNKLN